MKAINYYDNLLAELLKAVKGSHPDSALQSDLESDINDIKAFFNEKKDLEYNDFLVSFKEKYGNIIKQHRETQKVKAIKTIKVAAILYIITFILGVIGVIVYLAQSSGSSY